MRCAGVLAAPPPQSRQNLVANLGSDHIPLVVDFGLCTPSVKHAMPQVKPQTGQNRSSAVSSSSSASSGSAASHDLLDLLKSMEEKLAVLEATMSRPFVLVELKWALCASTFVSILVAASSLQFGRKGQARKPAADAIFEVKPTGQNCRSFSFQTGESNDTGIFT